MCCNLKCGRFDRLDNGRLVYLLTADPCDASTCCSCGIHRLLRSRSDQEKKTMEDHRSQEGFYFGLDCRELWIYFGVGLAFGALFAGLYVYMAGFVSM